MPPIIDPEKPVHLPVPSPIVAGRILVILVGGYAGWAIGKMGAPPRGLEGTAVGLFLAAFLVGCEIASGRVAPRRLAMAMAGLIGGLALGHLSAPLLLPLFSTVTERTEALARLIACLAGAYLGIMLALKNAGLIALFQSGQAGRGDSDGDRLRILDTSVVIDGRIRGLIEAGLLPGGLIVPEFVLLELQKLSDSADPLKRSKGLRGLALLADLRKVTSRIAVMEHDYPEIEETDHKLVALAREIGGELVTNDSNLQKVATVQNLRVLNINEVAALLRPSVAQGDVIDLALQREGREPGQAVGSLEDGTMVIVDDAKAHVGQTRRVEITRVLQTGNGRVVFARLSPPHAPE